MFPTCRAGPPYPCCLAVSAFQESTSFHHREQVWFPTEKLRFLSHSAAFWASSQSGLATGGNDTLRQPCETFFFCSQSFYLSPPSRSFPAQAADCHALIQGHAARLFDLDSGARQWRKLLLRPYGATLTGLPAFCRVSGILHPTSDSVIRFEVWMPEKGWNHRFLGTGNGGFAGSIYYGQLADSLKRGYATAGTDAGHQADAQDASWAYQHPEKITDFGYRAVHLTTERAKAIVTRSTANLRRSPYFDACSDSEREALMEAQRFPADYDGILAGAPANNWTNLLAATVDVTKVFIGNPQGYIPSIKLPAITAAVLAKCDAQDGLKDGILNDPRTCHFDPATLLCKQDDELSCLTAPQIASLKKIYAGGTDDEGHLIFLRPDARRRSAPMEELAGRRQPGPGARACTPRTTSATWCLMIRAGTL